MKGDTTNKIYKKNFGIFEGTISARLFIFKREATTFKVHLQNCPLHIQLLERTTFLPTAIFYLETPSSIHSPKNILLILTIDV